MNTINGEMTDYSVKVTEQVTGHLKIFMDS